MVGVNVSILVSIWSHLFIRLTLVSLFTLIHFMCNVYGFVFAYITYLWDKEYYSYTAYIIYICLTLHGSVSLGLL